jgi:hypothetical protein
MRRQLSLIALMAAPALAAAALASGCSSGASIDPVAQAAEATSHAGGARIALSGTVTVPGANSPVTLSGAGQINLATQEGDLALGVGGLPALATVGLSGGALSMHEVLAGGAVYIGSPLFAGRLPGGARWLKIDLRKTGTALGLDPGSLLSGGVDPAQYLQFLRAHGARVTPAGHDSVRGVATTRYSVEVDLAKAAEGLAAGATGPSRDGIKQLLAQAGLRTLPMEVWVDGSHMVRKVAIAINGVGGAPGAGLRIAVEYFDFGATPAIHPPAAGEVFEVSSQMLSGLTGAGA